MAQIDETRSPALKGLSRNTALTFGYGSFPQRHRRGGGHEPDFAAQFNLLKEKTCFFVMRTKLTTPKRLTVPAT